jgi:hypothetical protein
MQVSVVSALHSFSADRMVAQYLDEVYLGPAPGSTSTTAE